MNPPLESYPKPVIRVTLLPSDAALAFAVSWKIRFVHPKFARFAIRARRLGETHPPLRHVQRIASAHAGRPRWTCRRWSNAVC